MTPTSAVSLATTVIALWACAVSSSLAAALFSRLTSEEPWLIWRAGEAADADVLEIFHQALSDLLKQDTLKALRARFERELGGGGPGLLGALGSMIGAGRQARAGIPDALMEVLVSRLGIPRSAIESMAHDVLRRLSRLGEG